MHYHQAQRFTDYKDRTERIRTEAHVRDTNLSYLHFPPLMPESYILN